MAVGRALTSKEKIHQVRLIRGLPFNRLVKIEGRELTPEESKREDAREERFQQKFVSADRRKMAARKEALVTPELLARYQFAVKAARGPRQPAHAVSHIQTQRWGHAGAIGRGQDPEPADRHAVD